MSEKERKKIRECILEFVTAYIDECEIVPTIERTAQKTGEKIHNIFTVFSEQELDLLFTNF